VPKSGGAYTEHAFVRALGDGALPEACFRHYLFLIHFARAYALADYKSETLDDIRQAAQNSTWRPISISMMAEKPRAAWGLDEAAMQAPRS
jgi:thiaminase/transcriptional activator TenA